MIGQRSDIAMGDYLTDETRLYWVNRAITVGTSSKPTKYRVENCFTEHEMELGRTAVLRMRRVIPTKPV